MRIRLVGTRLHILYLSLLEAPPGSYHPIYASQYKKTATTEQQNLLGAAAQMSEDLDPWAPFHTTRAHSPGRLVNSQRTSRDAEASCTFQTGTISTVSMEPVTALFTLWAVSSISAMALNMAARPCRVPEKATNEGKEMSASSVAARQSRSRHHELRHSVS